MSKTKKFKSEFDAATWLQNNGYRYCGHRYSHNDWEDKNNGGRIPKMGKDLLGGSSCFTMWLSNLAGSTHVYGDGRAELYPHIYLYGNRDWNRHAFYVRLLTATD